MSSIASIGPANLTPKDNVKPGISRLFPLRLALRFAEVLRAIKRGTLPGVHKTDNVKTNGTTAWQGCGPVQRLFVPDGHCDYGSLAARSLRTLLEGTKGRSADRLADDVAVVGSLRTTAPNLSATFVENILADTQETVGRCNRRITSGKKDKARVRKASMHAVQVQLEDASSSTAGPIAPAVTECPELAISILQPERSSSTRSLASSASGTQSDGGACDEDDTVSEHDSRSEATDDSYSGSAYHKVAFCRKVLL